MKIFLFILLHNILPIMFIIMTGFALGKAFRLETNALSKMMIYVLMPFFIFVQIYTTDMPSDILKILIFAVLLAAGNLIISSLIAHLRHFNAPVKNAFVNSVMFYNSGNIGIPLITLVFSSAPYLIGGKTPWLTTALTTQIVILVVQNISINTIGFFNAGRGHTSWKGSLKSILTLPSLYTVALAFLLKLLPYRLENFVLWPAFEYLKDALVGFALLTLGIQLARTKLKLKNGDVYLSNFVRLIVGPLFAFAIIKLLHLGGIPAQTLMISSALPTAVNTALIAMERDNEPDFACQSVVTATILAAFTLVFVVYAARFLFPV